MRIPVGSKVKFREEKLRYTVQASDGRYAICTKPFNVRHTVLYTICDFQIGMRGPENLVFGMGAETREQCEEMLDRLNGRDRTSPEEQKQMEDLCRDNGIDPSFVAPDTTCTEVSHRNRIEIDIQFIEPPKEK